VPIAVVVLARLGIVSIEKLKEFRAYFVVLAFIIAAVLTPPDAGADGSPLDAGRLDAGAEAAPDADGGQLTAVHEPVDRHLGYPHHRGHLGDREELYLGRPGLFIRQHGHRVLTTSRAVGLPLPRSVTHLF